ncbi:CRTAC1 family protein [Pseudoalteromonas luteoviolacea]|uniref:CRTAC1 family protein n=1 Tax=Pseudoalteromonas luteoviolacea TaxID=43657 RepID=UPI001B39DD77|nr:CRTAC1 family protein [Pseudoalteromonas luteoviolacea]MBQ4876560.1 CRTAC1 family protein [Pseudoalteromonas luteoviolacea]MBQ4905191.1 CRTAC1 family protein [Pseudoalteromonas luteoviolacea]
MKKSLIVVALLLAGCGGGGSSESTAPAVSDQVDQDKPTVTEPVPVAEEQFFFIEKSEESNITYAHDFSLDRDATISEAFVGGIAAGDIDNDGDLDIALLGEHLVVLTNDGKGQFTDVSQAMGVSNISGMLTGLSFGDVDADGFIDLFVGGVSGQAPRLLKNVNGQKFEDITQQVGFTVSKGNTVSASFADLDGDSDLDIILSHWGEAIVDGVSTEHIWINGIDDGTLTFTDKSLEYGLNKIYQDQVNGLDSSYKNVAKLSTDTSFTPLVVDIDQDNDQDILMVSDFGGTKVLIQNNGKLTNMSDSNINDQSGMGSALFDVDFDGDLDWFVTSIFRKKRDDHQPNFSLDWHGNKFYVNDGSGQFVDNAAELGVENGGWAWATCFADFNHDGNIDIFQSNGWGVEDKTFNQYLTDNYKLYLGSSSGKYQEHAFKSRITSIKEEGENWQGRGVVCNDLDGDGDIDILVSRNQQSMQYFENQLQSNNQYLKVRLRQSGLNRFALGSTVLVEFESGKVQSRFLSGNSHYVSQSAPIAHITVPTDDNIKSVTVKWPDNSLETVTDFSLNKINYVEKD